MATVQEKSAVDRFVLGDTSWPSYLHILRAFEGKRRLRITYDRGSLELMTLSFEHERIRHLLNLLLVVLAGELKMTMVGGGSLTLKRRKKKRGLEPDQCYWFQHAAQMSAKTEYDFRHDPPPELVVEVEVSRSIINRLDIYASFKIPEIWRWTGDNMEVRLLDAQGKKYDVSETSKILSPFRPAELVPFLTVEAKKGDLQMMEAFRAWVQERIASGWGDET